ncbi:tyrosinase family oxidase copper chaperone [Streptomyces sp. NPDC048191]|uniref:apotyrosinase chaperone MelC1 n=1 Tax=Streptomyces sp. NPDC048191 TaxID=3155484 RepID=UPI0033F9009C
MQRLTRRDMLRGSTLALAGAAFATPAAIATASSHTQETGKDRDMSRTTDLTGPAAATPEAFDEIYLGRHIKGWPATGGPSGRDARAQSNHRTAGSPEPAEFIVRIDDADLHVMQGADGTWVSVVNHYTRQRTPRETARAAVRDLKGASLVPLMA